MAIKDRIKDFPELNPEFILENKGEFLVAIDVDSATLSSSQKNLVNSYDQDILNDLSRRLQNYINSKYENINTYKIKDKQYEIVDIFQNAIRYKRIFYYLRFEQSDLILKKIKDNEQNLKKVLNSNISILNFNPTQKDKNTVVARVIQNPIFEEDDYTRKFKEWYLCSFEEVKQELPIKTALNLILKSLSKKGTWIAGDSSKEIVKSSKNEVSLVPLSLNKIEKTKEKEEVYYKPIVEEELLSNFEQNIISFYKSHSFSNTNAEILFNENSFASGFSIFQNTFKDPVTNNNSYLIGLPKSLIEQFPNLLLSIDYNDLPSDDFVEFDNLADIKNRVEALRNVINKKKDSLSSLSLVIKNYDIDFYLSNIEQFISEFTNKIQEKKFDSDKKIILYFKKKPCAQKPIDLNNPSVNLVNDAEYKKCLNEFVDGQTNFFYFSTLIGQLNFSYASSSMIDGNLSSYLLINCKKIVNASDSYTAKNFFSKLIYSKTQFEKEEKLDLSTFYKAGQVSFQNSFINDAANIVKYSKIKQNLEKENYKRKTVSQNIRDALADINNIKRLYETILYRFDLKDVAEELIQCILSQNPSINDAIIGAQQFISSLISLLNTNDPNIIKLANCLNLKIPTSLGAIKLEDLPPAGDYVINSEEIKSSLSSLLLSAVQTASDVDIVLPTIIKCYDEFGNQQIKALINTYVEAEQVRKALKQQYDQLVLEAKTYKSAPGVKDSLKKQSAQKKTFIKKAIRNAWVLFQRQAEQEAERLIVEAASILIKSLLKDLNDCKPENSKNKKNNQTGAPGDLRLQGNSNLLDAKINNLLQELSATLNPEKLCSIFYGSADDETYETILGLIKQKISDLYTSTQIIKIGNTVFFSEPLSSVQAVRKFFISLSTANPEITTKKCDDYFESISGSPFDINDQEKCIDFSQEYTQKKKQELTDKGFTEEQAEQIINNQKSLQTEKYKNLQKTLEVGIYNEITSESLNKNYPASDIVKQKIEEQLEILSVSNSEFIDAYKNQLIELTAGSTPSGAQLPDFGETFATYEAIFGQNGDIFKIGANTIFYKKSQTLNPYKEINPIYQYTANEPYSISLKSQDYDSLKSAEPITPAFSLKKKLKLLWSNFDVGFSNFDDIEDNFWFEVCLSNSAVFYSKKILELYKQNYDIIKEEKFDKNKILVDIKELIYFEEE